MVTIRARSRSYRGHRRAFVAGLTAFLVVLGTTTAFADDVFSDGDGLTPVGNNNMNFGTVCVNTTTNKLALIAIRRNGGAGTPASTRTPRPSRSRFQR